MSPRSRYMGPAKRWLSVTVSQTKAGSRAIKITKTGALFAHVSTNPCEKGLKRSPLKMSCHSGNATNDTAKNTSQ